VSSREAVQQGMAAVRFVAAAPPDVNDAEWVIEAGRNSAPY
jgi:hypothetical protein